VRLEEIWDWLRTSPLLWLLVTLGGYELGRWLRTRTGHPLAQPVLVAIVVVGSAVSLLRVEYDTYVDATAILTFLLGPATVALAIPLYHQAHRLAGIVVPVLLALGLGAAVSLSTGIVLVQALGGSEQLARTMAPKSATAPVAIALVDHLGGVTELVAVFTTLAGTLGAVVGPAVLDLFRVRDPRARGLAVGAVSHGIGTSRLLHDDHVAGAFAGLAMGLTALATCLVAPLLEPVLL